MVKERWGKESSKDLLTGKEGLATLGWIESFTSRVLVLCSFDAATS